MILPTQVREADTVWYATDHNHNFALALTPCPGGLPLSPFAAKPLLKQRAFRRFGFQKIISAKAIYQPFVGGLFITRIKELAGAC